MKSTDVVNAHADIAIVGGGSVGVSFLAQFIKCLGQQKNGPAGPIRILLFEPRELPGGGEAYSPDLNTNLLNIPVRNMSAYADDKTHFRRWLAELSPSTLARFGVTDYDGDSFLPRPLFGHYMESVYSESQRQVATGAISLQHIQGSASALNKNKHDNWEISCGSELYTATRVVLCNGNLPSIAFPELERHARYFNNPYPVSKLVQSIERTANVGIIGSSLSAIDAIVALKQAGHEGMIICASRNGRLPSVRSVHNRSTHDAQLTAQAIRQLAQSHHGRLTLQQFFTLLKSQISALGGQPDIADMLGPQLPADATLDHEVQVSQERERLWQVVCSSSNEIIDLVWHLLPDEERRAYYTHWRSIWMARRATFPMQNALKLQHYFKSGALQVLKGYRQCRHDAGLGTFVLSVQAEQGVSEEIHHVDYVVNATSFSLDAANANDTLIKHLLQQGHAVADPFGGLKLDYDTGCLIDAQGGTQPTLSLLGSLAVGTYFWTLSMDVNARLALDQAQQIVQRLRQEHRFPATTKHDGQYARN